MHCFDMASVVCDLFLLSVNPLKCHCIVIIAFSGKISLHFFLSSDFMVTFCFAPKFIYESTHDEINNMTSTLQ